MLSLHTIIPPCLLLCAVIEALQLPPFPEFKINSDIVPRDQRSRTFADIRIGNGLIDWEPYDLDIQKYPIIETTRKDLLVSKQVLLIPGGDGVQYECFLPTQQQPSTESTEVVNLDAPSQLDLVRKRLEKPKQTCLQLQGGFWAYEVCPMKHVRQYHREVKKGTLGGKPVVPEGTRALFGGALVEVLQSVLGRGEQEIITDEYLLGRYIPGSESDRIVDGLLVQLYVDGDRCGEADGNISRQAEVRYECNLSKDLDHIISVTEVSSCRYTIRIGSPRACSANAILAGSKGAIKCYPTAAPPSKPYKNDSHSLTGTKPDGNPQRGDPDREGFAKQNEGKDRVFWRKRLREFISHDAREYPVIHKVLQEFMEAEHLAIPDGDQDLPERLVQKWFALLGLDAVEKHESADEGQATDKKTREESGHGKKSRRTSKPDHDVVFQIRL